MTNDTITVTVTVDRSDAEAYASNWRTTDVDYPGRTGTGRVAYAFADAIRAAMPKPITVGCYVRHKGVADAWAQRMEVVAVRVIDGDTRVCVIDGDDEAAWYYAEYLEVIAPEQAPQANAPQGGA